MAELIDGIGQLLWNDETFKGLCPGGWAKMRRNENGRLPALTLQVVGGRSEPTLDGTGPQRWRIQIDVHGEAADDVYAVRARVRQLLDAFSGELPNGFVVALIWLLQPVDYDDPQPRQFRASAEYYASFNFQS